MPSKPIAVRRGRAVLRLDGEGLDLEEERPRPLDAGEDDRARPRSRARFRGRARTGSRPRRGRRPSSRRRPSSCTGPKRFFSARTTRCAWKRSPSNERTASTRCSSVFGPASVPSFVTWPIRKTGTPVVFASARRRPAQARTCVTEPGGRGRRPPRRSSGSSPRRPRRTSRPSAASRIASSVGLGEEEEPGRRRRSEPVGPHPDLPRGLLRR